MSPSARGPQQGSPPAAPCLPLPEPSCCRGRGEASLAQMQFCFSGGSVAGCQQCLSGAQAPASLLPSQILGRKARAHLRAPKRRNLRLCSHHSPLLFFQGAARQLHSSPASLGTSLVANTSQLRYGAGETAGERDGDGPSAARRAPGSGVKPLTLWPGLSARARGTRLGAGQGGVCHSGGRRAALAPGLPRAAAGSRRARRPSPPGRARA